MDDGEGAGDDKKFCVGDGVPSEDERSSAWSEVRGVGGKGRSEEEDEGGGVDKHFGRRGYDEGKSFAGRKSRCLGDDSMDRQV